jgi:fatty acid desaturase
MQRSTIWGLIMIALGGLLLLANAGYGIDWDILWRLWPAILIYAGLVRILRYAGL